MPNLRYIVYLAYPLLSKQSYLKLAEFKTSAHSVRVIIVCRTRKENAFSIRSRFKRRRRIRFESGAKNNRSKASAFGYIRCEAFSTRKIHSTVDSRNSAAVSISQEVRVKRDKASERP